MSTCKGAPESVTCMQELSVTRTCTEFSVRPGRISAILRHCLPRRAAASSRRVSSRGMNEKRALGPPREASSLSFAFAFFAFSSIFFFNFISAISCSLSASRSSSSTAGALDMTTDAGSGDWSTCLKPSAASRQIDFADPLLPEVSVSPLRLKDPGLEDPGLARSWLARSRHSSSIGVHLWFINPGPVVEAATAATHAAASASSSCCSANTAAARAVAITSAFMLAFSVAWGSSRVGVPGSAIRKQRPALLCDYRIVRLSCVSCLSPSRHLPKRAKSAPSRKG